MHEHDFANSARACRAIAHRSRQAHAQILSTPRPGRRVEGRCVAGPRLPTARLKHFLRQRIADSFPRDGILGEEFGEQSGSSGLRWILDPIDGTKSFISGVPLYGTLVGIERDGQGVAGVIHIPALGETAFAASGQAAWYQKGSAAPAPAQVSRRAKLADALFCTSDSGTFAERGRFDAFTRLASAARLSRTWGDCYGYLLVATGRAELMVDPRMSVWDAAAVQPILEAAGGKFHRLGRTPDDSKAAKALARTAWCSTKCWQSPALRTPRRKAAVGFLTGPLRFICGRVRERRFSSSSFRP